MPDIADGILVQPSETMLPTGWMAYDADDRVVEVGFASIVEVGFASIMGGVSTTVRTRIGGNNVVTRIVCGRQFYDDSQVHRQSD